MANQMCIQSVSIWQKIRIHLLSLVFGVWILFKKLNMRIWSPRKGSPISLRDSPPGCLTDSTLGQHKYVKLKEVKLHYVESGSPGQPLILLLHGFPDFWLGWRYQIPILSISFHVVALDLKGFGDSDKPVWRSNYKLEDVLDELKQFIFSLGVCKCIVIGHDLGALLGWYLAHQTPHVVTKFFAVSCPHPNVYWQTFSSTRGYQWLNFVQLPYLPEIDALKDVKIIDHYYNHLSGKDMYLDAYKYTFCRKDDWTGPINYYRNLAFLKVKEQLEISVPVVLIIGGKDKVVKLEGIVKSTEFCQSSRMKIIDGSGHFPHQDTPEEFNKILLKFLREDSDSGKINENWISPSKRLINGVFGAISSTVKYSNSVISTVQKKTSL